ncbi:MAG: class I SAM-dependent methyltransferase [Kofleriaceae bacterium]|nr:class I SAM-dependent methyltransferase [Kofleriaceae bacterium]
MDNRSYYDDFSNWYERERGDGYHKMLDDLELTAVERYGTGKDILEAGCGTGLLLGRSLRFAKSARGVDLSAGMLSKAKERGLDVVQGSITQLPYKDESFDLVYSVKVLAHIEDIERAMSEMARVTRPGGVVLAEFYNPLSLRYLIKSLKAPTAISSETNDEAVYTRYDGPEQIRKYLPDDLEWVGCRGVRIITPFSQVHKIPLLGPALRAAESVLADAPIARNLGGFLIAILRKV